jgi:CheY-like chemotaxis protein
MSMHPTLVLLVDDDEIERRVLKRWLTPHFENGVTFVEAKNPDEAYEKIKENHKFPDWIISDHNMPSGEGAPFLESLEKAEHPCLMTLRTSEPKEVFEPWTPSRTYVQKKSEREISTLQALAREHFNPTSFQEITLSAAPSSTNVTYASSSRIIDSRPPSPTSCFACCFGKKRNQTTPKGDSSAEA